MSPFDSQVRILVTHYRQRLTDYGGASEKWAVDAIVTAGLLVDDDLLHVKQILHEYVKVKTEAQEKTVFKITRVR